MHILFLVCKTTIKTSSGKAKGSERILKRKGVKGIEFVQFIIKRQVK